jgi:thiol-disulfide isomerase/thioredoxin
MKTVYIKAGLVLLFIALFAVGCGSGDENADVTEGIPVLPGEQFDIADFRGNVVVVDFFGTYCKGCEEEVDNLVVITEEYRNEDVAVIGVCLDKDAPKSVPPYALEHNINYPIYDGSDAEIKSAYKIIGIPTTIFFDKEGGEAARKFGAMSREEIAAEIDALLND